MMIMVSTLEALVEDTLSMICVTSYPRYQSQWRIDSYGDHPKLIDMCNIKCTILAVIVHAPNQLNI